MYKWITFVEGHVKMVAIIGGIGLALFLGNKYLNYSHDEAVGKNAVAQQQLQDQIAKNQELAAQSAASQQAYAKLAAQISTQNTLIAAQITALKQKTAQQQQIDATLPLAELAKRWLTLINSAAPQDVQVTGDNLSVSGQASRTTVQNLEMVDSLHEEVLAGHKVEDNLTAQVTSCAAVNKAQTDQISGLNAQLKDEQNACETQSAVVKSGARKSKLKWFIGGILGGILTAFKLGI